MLQQLNRLAAMTVIAMAPVVGADELASNIDATVAGDEVVESCCAIAAAFTTDAESHQLNSVTLRVATTDAAVVQLALFNDAGDEPGASLGTFTLNGSIPDSTLETTTFQMTPPLELDPATTYWVVAIPQDGSVAWAWTEDEDGTGIGFDPTWARSNEADIAWWLHDRYPLQLEVIVDESDAADLDGDGDVDTDDLLAMLANWGACDGCNADLDGNGTVDVNDLLQLLAAWS